MASSLSNFSVSVPFSSERNGGFFKPTHVRFGTHFRPVFGKKSIKAVAGGDRKENLDHLQKVGKPQPTQQAKRGSQVSTPIGLWDRFPTARTVQQMMETMERMMEDPLAYGSTTWPSSVPRENGNGNNYRRGRTPWDIKEGENEYQLRFDMPGMTKSDIKVYIEEKMLVVKAEKESKQIEKGENGEGGEDEVWSAKSYGKYSSRIALPENVEYEKIKAEVKDGVLYITIPKSTTSTKVLDINVE